MEREMRMETQSANFRRMDRKCRFSHRPTELALIDSVEGSGAAATVESIRYPEPHPVKNNASSLPLNPKERPF